MQLELTIAIACGPASCRVRGVENGSEVEAAYAPAMQDRIKIRPGDLVVVDVAVQPPLTVWRSWLGTVKLVEPHRAVVALGRGDGRGQVVEVALPREAQERPAPAVEAGVGDEVFLTHKDGTHEILDLARDGEPVDPARLREVLFPQVSALYAAR